MANKLKDTTPRPRIGKTAKDTRMARLIDINQVVDEFNTEQVALETRVEALENAPAPTPTSEYTETIVNITSTETTYSDGRPLVPSGILAMGTTPIELLSAAGVGKYYDVDKVVFEYTHVTTPYDGGQLLSVFQYSATIDNLIEGAENRFCILKVGQAVIQGASENSAESIALNTSVDLTTWSGSNPTSGDGTLRVKIYHKTITFGA